jgi:hypothetical protein
MPSDFYLTITDLNWIPSFAGMTEVCHPERDSGSKKIIHSAKPSKYRHRQLFWQDTMLKEVR